VDFTFTQEQQMMAAAFRELLDDVCSPAELRRAADEGNRDSSLRWRRIAELGLPGLLAPESSGGMGLTDVDFVLIAEEAGRAALPDALVEHAGIAVPLLTELAAGSHAASARAREWLMRAASGEARIAIGCDFNPFVLGASQADALILVAGDAIHLVERQSVQLRDQHSIDPLRSLSRVEWTPDASTIIGVARHVAWMRAIERGAIYNAAQCAGLAQRIVELSVAYTLQRTQFGKPIGSCQALKHHLANVQVKLEFARPLIYSAAARLSALDARTSAVVSSAKLAAGDAADAAARTGLQVHGAMGYSWEVDLHFYMKRVWALVGAWGDRNHHSRRLQSLILDGDVALGPDRTFDRSESVA
jgi:alkylation response protein AidB-like acyl-CoA dehydrogenase